MRAARSIALVVLLWGAGSVLAQQPTPPPKTRGVPPPAPSYVELRCGASTLPVQQPTPPPKTPGVPAPAPTVVAASVNGQAIPELAVFRALQKVQPSQRDAARKDVLQFLIDTALID